MERGNKNNVSAHGWISCLSGIRFHPTIYRQCSSHSLSSVRLFCKPKKWPLAEWSHRMTRLAPSSGPKQIAGKAKVGYTHKTVIRAASNGRCWWRVVSYRNGEKIGKDDFQSKMIIHFSYVPSRIAKWNTDTTAIILNLGGWNRWIIPLAFLKYQPEINGPDNYIYAANICQTHSKKNTHHTETPPFHSS